MTRLAIAEQTDKNMTWMIAGLATFLVWFPTLWGGFLHDDYTLVEKGISSSIQAGRIGRMASVIIFQYTKNMPIVYRLGVVAFHCINSILIFLIAEQLLRKQRASLLIAMAFSISYLVADAIFWSMTVLWGSAVFTTILILLKNQHTNRFWKSVGLPLLVIVFAGAFFHEGVAVVPVVVASYYAFMERKAKYVLLSFLLISVGVASLFLQIETYKAMGYQQFSAGLMSNFFLRPQGVASNTVSAILFFITSPWYQIFRLIGAGSIMGTIFSLIIASIFVLVHFNFRYFTMTAARSLAWISVSAFICLLPGSVLGLNSGTKIPTMGSRYLYVAWGLFLIIGGVLLFSDPKSKPRMKILSRIMISCLILLNILLVGISQYGFLKRCSLDKIFVKTVSDKIAACIGQVPEKDTKKIVLVFGDFRLVPFQFPSPPPDLLQKNPGGMRSMLALHGVPVDTIKVESFNPGGMREMCLENDVETVVSLNLSSL